MGWIWELKFNPHRSPGNQRGDDVERASNLPFIGRGSSPASSPLHSGFGQAIYTCVLLSSSSITWYWSRASGK